MIVMTRSQDHVEAINSTLRKAGHPVHCTWLPDARDLGECQGSQCSCAHLRRVGACGALIAVSGVELSEKFGGSCGDVGLIKRSFSQCWLAF